MLAHDAENPYPGLRPFHRDESHLFFGRERQVDTLLGRLDRARFVAVVGASGTGKSSMVRAGLLPSLIGGTSPGLGSHWRIALMRPGGAPITNLARSLIPEGAANPDAALAVVESRLRRSGLGLTDVATTELDGRERLLVVVDQFEELFRYDSVDSAHDDAAAFVRLLIEATRSEDAPVYVVLTMRSDFIGDCSRYADLPEAVNGGLHLVPRLTRTERRAAIVGPAAVAGAEFTPRLVQRLLNDAGADPARLPVLQHALMRTWDEWAGTRTGRIDLEHYVATGGIGVALSRHADEAYEGLDDGDRWTIESVFRRLASRDNSGVLTRSPQTATELAAVCEVSVSDIERVVARFSSSEASFLVTTPDGVVDISHESLIREWIRLRDWLSDESRSAARYRRLLDNAERHSVGEHGLLLNPELAITQEWWDEHRPTAAWADRYGARFELAEDYLHQSRRAHRRRRAVLIAIPAAFVLVGFVGIAALAANERRDADRTEAVLAEAEAARKQAAEARADAALAEALLAEAEAALAVAQDETDRAAAQAALAEAEAALAVAQDEANRAEAQVLGFIPSSAITAEASSELPDANGITYSIGNTLDDDLTTAWNHDSMGGRDDGVDETLRYEFDQRYDLRSIEIVNGYAKDPEVYAENSRVQELRVTTVPAGSHRFDLEDRDADQRTTAQTLEADFGCVDSVTLQVVSVHSGDRYADVGVTEIRFNVVAGGNTCNQ